jgi:hypothetical protein
MHFPGLSGINKKTLKKTPYILGFIQNHDLPNSSNLKLFKHQTLQTSNSSNVERFPNSSKKNTGATVK